MCNNCECDFDYLCSIVGYQKYGACCEKCDNYDKPHTCPIYFTELINPQKEIIPKVQVLLERFSLQVGKTEEKAIELYP